MGEGVLDSEHTPLIRTDFTNPSAWRDVLDAVDRDWEDGFRALVSAIDDPKYDGWTIEQLVASPCARGHSILLIADTTTMTHPERLVLCADVLSSGKPFRIILPELWSVENNLSLANMDYGDFAEATDAEGVFRGFK
ncbi:MAG TPA: hypothetical protein VH189_15950 [Rhizomicrobium sp.]|nr:hypothetical protein [Rhizomicrobium sp.]